MEAINGVTFEDWGAASGNIAAGMSAEEVCEILGLELPVWQKTNEEWTGKLGDLMAEDHLGNNVLFYAIAGGNKEIINRLINMRYFDMSHINSFGETALKVSLRYRLFDIANRIASESNEIKRTIKTI